MLDIVVEANVTSAGRTVRGGNTLQFSIPRPTSQTQIKGYDIHEMLGTKMRAMFSGSAGGFVRFVLGAHQIANPG